ncbi:MAG: hypothetical protein MUF18_10725 [Fimbriiglobus sp.]|jgi:hypothetical protein|nr:hypothetical protein [Fimbriiglobus sp.]
MKKLLLGLLLVLPAVGCMSFRPVGMLDPTGESRREVGPEGVKAVEAAARVPDAPPPPPAPVQLVSADDIDPANPAEAVRKLSEEIDADRKAVDEFPNYPRVSKVKVK